MLVRVLLLLLLMPLGSGGLAPVPAEQSLAGVWQAVTYHHDGRDDPMEGLLVFTDRHFSAVVRFRISGGPVPDLNATTGTYRTGGATIIFVRQIAANIRSGDKVQPIRYSSG